MAIFEDLLAFYLWKRKNSLTSRKRPPKMQRLGGRLWESDRKGEIFKSTSNGVVYLFQKKIMKVFFLLPITGSFIDKIISYSIWQFMYGSALN